MLTLGSLQLLLENQGQKYFLTDYDLTRRQTAGTAAAVQRRFDAATLRGAAGLAGAVENSW